MSANLLQVKSANKSFAKRTLFDNASFSINEDEHIGVIGPNGAGKSTLFNIMTGKETLDNGDIIKSTALRLGYLQQEVIWGASDTLEDYLKPCIKPLWELKSLARQLDLNDAHFTTPMNSFSGGYRMRCKLLYLLGFEPNLMLLDEPTNYLDLETVLVLESFLQSYKGAFLLISHDREFLRRTTDHTLEVEGGEITKFNGNIDDYFEQKQMLREQLTKAALTQDAKRKTIEDFVNRFGAKASKARQAQSKMKLLDKMEKIEIKALPVSASLNIPTPEKTSKLAIKVEAGNFGYGDKVILKDVNCEIETGNHIAIVGYNGAGKSTFLKALAQRLPALSGNLNYGLRVKIGYFGQHVAEELKATRNLYEELQADAPSDLTRQQTLDMAGALLFSGDDAYKPISKLSGGEKARVALGKIFLQRPSVLILDEPTNHLDFYTVEALTQALNKYPGTIILVSHDRGFVGRVANKIFEIRNGALTTYLGSYDDYVWKIERENTRQSPEPVSIKPAGEKNTPFAEAQPRNDGAQLSFSELKQLQRQYEKSIRQCDTAITKAEQEMADLHSKIDRLAQQMERNPLQIRELGAELSENQGRYNTLEEGWYRLAEQKEEFKRLLAALMPPDKQ